ncbi:MAG: hypothetical protein NC218_02230 [Acetobacter sp.]|nr:hypothetical protein [Acetobacter sp.]
MEDTTYDVYSEFDPVKHKQRYKQYLEVLILEDGKIVYAIPSHQMKAEQICREKLNVSQQRLSKMCPKEYYFDYMTWLLMKSNAVAVWYNNYMGTPNERQKLQLRRLRLHGIYAGPVL